MANWPSLFKKSGLRRTTEVSFNRIPIYSSMTRLLWGDGEYRTVILHQEGYLVINGHLATSSATYELVPWQDVRIDTHHLKEGQKVPIWIRPQDAIEPFPAFEFTGMKYASEPQVVKLVAGKGVAAYLDASWSDSKFRHDIVIESSGSGTSTRPETVLPELPAGHIK